MKEWNVPAIEELNISETAQGWWGQYQDGGYVGDGHINLHLTTQKPENPS